MRFTTTTRGRRLRLSRPRRWMTDLMALTRAVPTGGGQRELRVGDAAEARRSLRDAPGWTAMIVKGYALIAARRPELRRVLLAWPWAHLHENPVSVCSVISEREWRGEPAVFADQITAPETMGLDELQYHLEGLRHWPIESIGGYRRWMRFLGLPWFPRRLLMRMGFNLWGAVRARYFGTFSINTLANARVVVNQSMTLTTLSLFHGVANREGRLPLYFFFDHRVLDGMTVARVTGELEAILNGEIAAELRAMADRPRWQPKRRDG